MAIITFDLDGTPITVNASTAKFVKQACYDLADVYYTYFLRFQYDINGLWQYMTIRLFTDTLTATTYRTANQLGMSDMEQIRNSNSMYLATVFDRGEVYNSDSAFQFIITGFNSGGDASGTFSGNISFYTTSISLSGSSVPILYPVPAITKVIANGVFTDIPVLT